MRERHLRASLGRLLPAVGRGAPLTAGRGRRPPRILGAGLLGVALACLVCAQGASAAAPLSWSGATPASGQPLSAVSCPSESLCVAVDRGGSALTTSDPGAAAPSWSSAGIDSGQRLTAVSCASSALCAAVDAAGNVFTSSNPLAGAWSRSAIDAGTVLTGVSCPTTSLCVAVDEAGNALASTAPLGGGWSKHSIDGSALTAVSCATASLCVAVDGAGSVLATGAPAGGGWSKRLIDGAALTGVSCLSASLCVAVDGGGNVLTSVDPGAAAPTWSATPIDSGARLAAISCASSGLCVAVDDHGRALASDNPGSPLPAWSETSADGAALTGISCLAGGICLAVDASGRSVTGRVPAPQAATLAPAEVGETQATLSGSVNPEDATLLACWFEVGPTAAYGMVIPCTHTPAANGGAQIVTAQVSGLVPNTTYHYRLFAASPVGTSAGADQSFTTALSTQVPRVTPHPSIRGTPAVGQRLTCLTGIPSGSEASVTYAWLRDLVPIPNASGSSYVVKGTDAGHHLQCQVTATNAGGSVTARSGFANVPAQGVLAAAGETRVGRARVSKTAVAVPVACSPHADAGCRIRLRLLLPGRARVTLGLAGAHLPRGRRATVSVSLNRNGRRLLKRRHPLVAQLTVSGTVIGVLEALLAQQRVVFGARTHRAALHAPTRRG